MGHGNGQLEKQENVCRLTVFFSLMMV